MAISTAIVPATDSIGRGRIAAHPDKVACRAGALSNPEPSGSARQSKWSRCLANSERPGSRSGQTPWPKLSTSANCATRENIPGPRERSAYYRDRYARAPNGTAGTRATANRRAKAQRATTPATCGARISWQANPIAKCPMNMGEDSNPVVAVGWNKIQLVKSVEIGLQEFGADISAPADHTESVEINGAGFRHVEEFVRH